MALIVDTGPLYAAMDRKDRAHKACATLLEESVEPLVVPSAVVVELDWLAASRLGPQAFDLFLESVVEGAVIVEDLVAEDYRRVRELCMRYADLPLGYVDATVVAVAERLGEKRIATLDRRHFGIVKPRHVRSFQLLPASHCS